MAGKIIPHLEDIKRCIDEHKDFVVNGGAGSGKTFTLVESLKYIYDKKPLAKVACITYTNVAVKEIQERVPYENLYVSTIHEFVWDIIKNYKNNLISAIIELVNKEKEEPKSGIRYSGDNEISIEAYKPCSIEYKDYLKIDEGIISHDEVLKLGRYLFHKYPFISRILGDKYDFIFVDEYQDTSELIIKLLLDIFRHNTNRSVIGFFGDPMQSIYGTGIGDLRDYIDVKKQLEEVEIQGNRRCSETVINVLNKIRSDIKQRPENNNAQGSVKFLYSYGSTDIEKVKENDIFKEWNFLDSQNTKEFYLTHRLIARRDHFETLFRLYQNSDRLIGDNPDKLAKHLLKLQEILFLYKSKKYNEFIDKTDFSILYHKDKEKLSEIMMKISDMGDSTIKDVVNFANENGICEIDDALKSYAIDNAELYSKVMDVSYKELVNLYNYRNRFSPYSTQHGIKGAEFDNVFVVLDNGNWNNYNFEQLLGSIRNQTIYERTRKLFYVCCSRAKKNLVVYCPNFKDSMKNKAIEWFGKENVEEI